jgi:hypothetical protein
MSWTCEGGQFHGAADDHLADDLAADGLVGPGEHLQQVGADGSANR